MNKNIKYIVGVATAILVGCSPSIYHKITKNVSYGESNDSLMLSFNEICVEDTLDIFEVAPSIKEMMVASLDKATTSLNNKIFNVVAKKAKISKKGKELIKSFESCSLTAYKLKGERHHTIGWGHVIYPGDKTPHKISQRKADSLFDEDMETYNALARESLAKLDPRFTYSQGFIDGLVSLIYNCGQAGMEKTRFWKAMQACRYDKKTNNINVDDLRYAISFVKTANISSQYKNGHTNRRKSEQSTMLAEL